MRTLLQSEPVAVTSAIRAVVLCAAAFGWHATAEQIAALMVAVEAVLAVVTRAAVSPVER